jgi:phosphate transport system substrate-binding protein
VGKQIWIKHQLLQYRKKFSFPLLLLSVTCAVLTLLLAGCVEVGNTGQQNALSGHLSVKGSTALQPLVTAAAQAFHRLHPQVNITVAGGGSVTGLNTVTTNQADIGDSDIYADPALYPDPSLTDHIVCVIPFAMVVNPDVTGVTSLTRQQIIDIYSTNTINNWDQVGGPDLPIVPVIRPATSGTRATFRKYVIDGRDQNGQLLQTDSSQTVLSTVAQTPGAIGYLALSVVNSSVHTIAIDGKAATPENIANGSYTFWGYEHMYTLGTSNQLANAFLDYMLTPEVQNMAQRMGYIPIAKMQISQTSQTSNKFASLSPSGAFVIRESEV